MLVNLSFGGFVVGIRTIQTDTLREASFVDLRAHDIPALAEVHYPTMELTRPTLGCNPNSFRLGHFTRPLESAKLCGANGLLLGPYTGLRLAEEIVGGRPVAELAVFNPGPGPLHYDQLGRAGCLVVPRLPA